MNPLSEEQQHVITLLKNNKNVVVDACAGSGKSTTVLTVAKTFPDDIICQVTYNSSLRTEIKEKTRVLDINNLEVHTYHSLAVCYYIPHCYTDTGLRHILYNDIKPNKVIPPYKIIVVDEAQDMSSLYCLFMKKFIRDIGEQHKILMLVLGDYMQGLYEFKGSDIRFLTLADKIWENHPNLLTPDFEKTTMKMSYRITRQMRDFVNKVLLGENRIDACRNGPRVQYIRFGRYKTEKIVIHIILNLIQNSGAKPSDFFVLGASVKGVNSNIRRMENTLVSNGIPCHVPILENDKIDERAINGKVVFSTFHCVKGRERKYVFVVGFDNNYFSIYARSIIDRSKCPNTLYVAATRATECLYLLENDQYATDRPLEFMKLTHHEMLQQNYMEFKGQPRSIFYTSIDEKTKRTIDRHYITPTELIRFVNETVIEEISPMLDKIFRRQSDTEMELLIPTVIETKKGFYEEVADINGIALQSIYYDTLENSFHDEKHSNILLQMILESIALIPSDSHTYLQQLVEELPNHIENIGDYIYMANIYIAIQERLYFKLKQIDRDEYTWLTPEIVDICKERLGNTIGKECKDIQPVIEETIIESCVEEDHESIDAFLAPHFPNQQFRFTARTDLITDASVWELKCVSKISIDHLLQVVIYAWLWKMLRGEDDQKAFKIFNIRTGELLVLESTMDELHTIMLALLTSKYSIQAPKTDEEFLKDVC